MGRKDKKKIVALKCSVCGQKNYTIFVKKQAQEKLEVKKYCKHDKEHTKHEQVKWK
jgi:large subunit ribosomal protein L33